MCVLWSCFGKTLCQIFVELFQGACKLSKSNPLIIIGNLNARDTSWGYSRTDARGKMIIQAVENLYFELLTDSVMPMQIGNSVNKDTSPDLTFIKGGDNITSLNLREPRKRLLHTAHESSCRSHKNTNWTSQDYQLDCFSSRKWGTAWQHNHPQRMVSNPHRGFETIA